MGFLWSFMRWGLLGGAIVYFLDPSSGSRRRSLLMDRATKLTNRGSKNVQATSEHVGGRTEGLVQETLRRNPPDNPYPDDNTLRDRVESEIFRDQTVPKGDININVVNGIVELRGELRSQSAIDKLVGDVEKIANVKGVHNYLHLPGTPAPNKESVLEASS